MTQRTIPALTQAIYAALTTQAFTYAVNAGSPQTLAAASIMAGEPVDIPDPKPDPLLTFAVGGRGRVSAAIPFRRADIHVSVSTGRPLGNLIVQEIYAVLLDRLESKDAEGSNQLTRVATSGTLALAAVTIEEVESHPAAFDKDSQRWYCTATLSAIAQ